MNVLQQFINLEYIDICHKIYAYIGAHPIVLNTDLKNKMIIYNDFENENDEDDFNDTFADYYFNNFLFNDLDYDNYLEDAAERY